MNASPRLDPGAPPRRRLSTTSLTVRAATSVEIEAGCPWRWLVVDADDPDSVLFERSMLGVAAGGSHLMSTIAHAQKFTRRGYTIKLPPELEVLSSAIFAAYEVVVSAGSHPVNTTIDTIENPREVLRDVIVTLMPEIQKEWI